MTEQELNERGWDMWNACGWKGRHRVTGKMIKAGTYLTLLHLLEYEEWNS